MMPDITKELDALYGGWSYENPNVRIGDWRLFLDDCGFIPSPSNTVLLGRCLAWLKGTDRYYASLVGCEDGAFQYYKGATFPQDIIARCFINAEAVCSPDVMTIVGEEIIKALNRLAALVCAEEHLENPLIERPLTIHDITGGDRVIWGGESRGIKLRVVRHTDWSISFQMASSYDVNGVPDDWSVVWT